MDRNEQSTYTVLELSTIHEDWHTWVFPHSQVGEAVDMLEELTLYGYEDLELHKVIYQKGMDVVLSKQLLNKTMAIYG